MSCFFDSQCIFIAEISALCTDVKSPIARIKEITD